MPYCFVREDQLTCLFGGHDAASWSALVRFSWRHFGFGSPVSLACALKSFCFSYFVTRNSTNSTLQYQWTCTFFLISVDFIPYLLHVISSSLLTLCFCWFLHQIRSRGLSDFWKRCVRSLRSFSTFLPIALVEDRSCVENVIEGNSVIRFGVLIRLVEVGIHLANSG